MPPDYEMVESSGGVDRRLLWLYLCGSTACQISRALKCSEEEAVKGVMSLRGLWVEKWETGELGQVVETVREVEERCLEQSRQPQLLLSERLRFQKLALDASALRVRIAGAVPRRRARGAVSDASYLWRRLTAAQAWRRRQQRIASPPSPCHTAYDVEDDTCRNVQRLAAQGLSTAAIVSRTGLSPSSVADHLESITSWWITKFGLEAGEAFSRARDNMERNFEAATWSGCSSADRGRLFAQVLASCKMCVKLLAGAEKRRQAWVASQGHSISEEELADTVKVLEKLEAEGYDVDEMF